MGSSVDSVKFVNFGTRRIAGIGIEPNLNAMVSMAQVDQVSAPVKGNNGVYVFKVYARNKDGKEFNEAEEIRALDRFERISCRIPSYPIYGQQR